MSDHLENKAQAEATLRSIAPYLRDDHPQAHSSREYTIDELALAADTTVRNIRAYQDKGLLHPPRLRGRKGIYNNQHLSRLRVIANLLDRGFTLGSIRELLGALEQGLGLQEVLGMEEAVTSPWSEDEVTTIPVSELQARFGDSLTETAVKTSIELGLVSLQGDQVRVASMRALNVAQQLHDIGIPLEKTLDVQRELRSHIEAVADVIVKLVTEHVLGQYGDGVPPKEDMPRLADMVWQLRPLAEQAVNAELGRAMDQATSGFLAGRFARVVEELHTGDDNND